MGRKTKTIDGGFIVLPKRTLRASEWQELTAGTRIVFISLLTEFIRDKKINPNNLVKITHRQLEAISGLGHSTVIRSMKSLKRSPFLEVEEQGGLELNHSTYKLNGRYLW